MNLFDEQNNIELINKTKSIVLYGKKQDLPVYKIDLKSLNYNIRNGRISSQINEYEIKNNIKLVKNENGDLTELNNLIEKFIIESNKAAFKSTKNSIDNFGQHEVGVVLSDGTIIDGNRRFTCLRDLNRNNPSKIEFLTFEAIILPENTSRKEIKQLELQIQHATEEKIDYDVMDKIIDVYKYIKIEKELTIEEYASNSSWNKSTINEYLETYELINDYLDSLGCENQLYLATNWKLQGPMREIWLVLKKVNDKTDKNNIKNLLFTFLKGSSFGDLTRDIRNYGKILLLELNNSNDELSENFIKLSELGNEIDGIFDNSLSVSQNLEKIKMSNTFKEFKKCLETCDRDLRFKNEKKREKEKLEEIYNMLDSLDMNKISISAVDVKNEITNICLKIEEKIEEIKFNAKKSKS